MITKIKTFINKYNWKKINFPSERHDWKISEKNNVTSTLIILYGKKEKICPAYVSKHNSNRETRVIVLMIPNGEEWHYLEVIKLSALLRGITSKHHGDFDCLNCLPSFATEKKFESHKKVCQNKYFLIQLCLLKTLKYQNLINMKNLVKHTLLFMQILNA